ncbi:MAG: putative Ig domain-containing protein [Acidobacteriota bacterium]
MPEGLEFRGYWIKGAPKKEGLYRFQVEATDALGQQAVDWFDLKVLAPPAPKLRIVDVPLPDAVACIPYGAALRCVGGQPPYSWTIADQRRLPEGFRLTQDQIVGTVKAVVAQPQRTSVPVTVTDKLGQSASATLQVTVNPNPRVLLRVDAETDDGVLILPPAVQERSYEATIPVRGGFGKVEWSVSGELPDGIQLTQSHLRGTAKKSGDWKFSVAVRDELDQRLTVSCGLEVLPPSPKPVEIVTKDLPKAALGDPFKAFLDAGGGAQPYMWTVRGLPDWAEQERNQIHGTPANVTAIGKTTVQVSVRDASGGESGPVSLPLEVVLNPRFPAPEVKPATSLIAIVDQVYQITIPVLGGCRPVRFDFGGSSPPPGLTWDPSGVIRGTPTQPGTWHVPVKIEDSLGQTNGSGPAADLELRIVEPPPPSLEIRTKSLPNAILGVPYRTILRGHGGWPPYEWEVSGKLPDWATLKDSVLSGTPSHVSAVNEHTISVSVTDARSNSAGPVRLTLTIRPNPAFDKPRIVFSELPMGLVGDEYSADVQIRDGQPPYRAEVIQQHLPADLNLSETGRLTGKIREIGNWHIKVRVVDSLGQQSTEQTVTLKTRQAAEATLRLGQFSPVTGIVGKTLEFRVPVSGGVLPYTFSRDGILPPGLEFDSEKGLLTGIPRAAGNWDLRLRVTDGAPEGVQVTGALHIHVPRTTRWIAWLPWCILCAVLFVEIFVNCLRFKRSRKADQGDNHPLPVT